MMKLNKDTKSANNIFLSSLPLLKKRLGMIFCYNANHQSHTKGKHYDHNQCYIVYEILHFHHHQTSVIVKARRQYHTLTSILTHYNSHTTRLNTHDEKFKSNK